METTQIKDSQGTEHRYTCEPFGFDDTVTIGLKIAAVMAGPVGAAIDAATSSAKSPKGSVNADALLEQSIDLSKVGDALGAAPERLLKQGGPQLIREILRRCKRGSLDASGKEVMYELNQTHVLDAAYRLNLGEMFKAVFWVLKVNYSPLASGDSITLTGLLSSLNGLLGGLGGLKPDETNQSPGTPMPVTAIG